MKNILSLIILTLLSGTLALGQSLDDAIRFSQTGLTGTARSAAMGNAFGALGGDFSSLSINPAGIAIYRSSEVSITPSLIYNNTKSTYFGSYSEDDDWSFPFNQIGFVSTNKMLNGDEKGIVSTHFAMGYNRLNNFNQNSVIQGDGVKSSMLGQFVIDADGYYPDQLDGFGNSLAFSTWLIDTLPGIGNQYFNAWEAIDQDGNVFWRANNGLGQRRVTDKSGYAGEYVFTMGINISNVLMIGGTFGIQSIHYRETSTYSEYNSYGLSHEPTPNNDLEHYDYYSYLNQTGTGLNFKFGVIIKPIPILRLGASIHTRTYFSILEQWDNKIVAHYKDNVTPSKTSEIGEYNYNFRTPFKATGSAALVLGKYMILSADYEYSNYSSSEFKPIAYSDNHLKDLNSQIDKRFKKAHKFRGGIEFKPLPQVGFRGGISYQDTPYKEQYQDKQSTFLTYSSGIGYRTMRYFIDFAYMLTNREYDYYNYNWDSSNDEYHGTPQPARIASKDNQFILTLGYRF